MKAADELHDLLAIIHRDGGHYLAEHGTVKTVNDAHKVWAELVAKAERVEAAEACARAADAVIAQARQCLQPWALTIEMLRELNAKIQAYDAARAKMEDE